MAENVLKLKKKAVELGADKAWAVKAGRTELEDFIANAGTKTKAAKKTTKKSTTKPAVAKKAGKKTAKKTETKAEGKSKVSKSKKTAKSSGAGSKKAPAVKSAKTGKAKRPSTQKADKDAGRVLITGIDWSVESDDWKPRANSPVMKLFKALKKTKGNVDKSYELLKGDMWEFVGKTKRDGTKRTKAEAETMLRYRLNRTKFEFATRTGQHAKGANRVEYGTGKHASANKKAKRAAAKAAPKTTAKKATAKKGKKSTKK